MLPSFQDVGVVVGVAAPVAGHDAAVVEAEEARSTKCSRSGRVAAIVAWKQCLVDATGRLDEAVPRVVAHIPSRIDREPSKDASRARALSEVVDHDDVAHGIVVVAQILVRRFAGQRGVSAIEAESLLVVGELHLDVVAEALEHGPTVRVVDRRSENRARGAVRRKQGQRGRGAAAEKALGAARAIR